MHKLLSKLFGSAEEINGSNRCPTYLYRWIVLKTWWFKAYIHHFVGEDWTLDLHDHPKRFISVGLWGSYVEQTPNDLKVYRAPWMRMFPASHIHRIGAKPGRSCWTAVIVFRASREWGFRHKGQFIGWRKYVDSEVAGRMKSCD